MKQLSKTLLVLAILSFSTTSNAQFFERLGEKATKAAERAVTRKVENKAEKTTEAAMDSILSPKERRKKKREEKSKEKSNSMGDLSGMMEEVINAKDIIIEDSYTFPITATMKITSYQNDGRVDQMTQSYGSKALYSIVANTQGPMITDFTNESIIILNLEEQTAKTMSLSWMEKIGQMGQPDDNDPGTTSVEKTGRTKTINGYTCHEYVMVNDDTTLKAWVAPEVPFSYKDYLQGFTKMLGTNVGSVPQDKGYVMLLDMYQKDEHQTKMEVTSISETPITIDLSTFKITNMMGN